MQTIYIKYGREDVSLTNHIRTEVKMRVPFNGSISNLLILLLIMIIVVLIKTDLRQLWQQQV